MRFKKITIENFKSIGSNPVVVDFNFNDTKLLLGTNGAGKTTIFDAITWCIYGVTKLKADNVVNKFIGLGTKVELEFSENRHDYVITRYRKHAVHKNNLYVFEDGNNITLKNPTDNQELVQKIVGIDSRAFNSSIILSSETYKQFLRETNAIRLQIFESVFNLREINDLSKINKQNIKDCEKTLSDKNIEAQSLDSFIQADTNALKAYKENYDKTVISLNAQIDKIQNENIELQKYLDDSSDIDIDIELQKAMEYQSLLLSYKSSKDDFDNLNKLLNSQKNELKSIELYIDTAIKYIDKYPYSEIKRQISYISDKNKADEEVAELNNEIKNLQDNNKSIINENSILLNKLDAVKSKIDAANKQIEQINNDVCPVCGNHIDTEHSKSVLEQQNLILKENLKVFDEINLKVESNKMQIENINNDIKSLNEKINSISCVVPDYTSEEIKIIVNQLKIYSDELPKYEELKTDKEIQIKDTELRISKIVMVEPEHPKYSVDALNKIKSDSISIKSKIEANKKIIETAKNTRDTAFDKEYVAKAAEAIQKRKQTIGIINSEVFNIKKELAEYNILDDVFSNSDNGFKKYFINKTIDLFNDKLNTFLPFFFEDDIEIKFDKDLNDTITFRGKDTEFDELSSGEKTRCELCVVFALYFMVRSLFGTGTNLLVLDELADRGLDTSGILSVKQILNDIAKDSAVFLVTHRDDLKETFTNALTVFKDGDGFTRVK